MAKQRTDSASGDVSLGGDRTAQGFDRRPDTPIEISVGELTAEELRELVEFDVGAEPEENEETFGHEPDAPHGGAGIPEPDLGKDSDSVSGMSGQHDPAHVHTSDAAAAASSNRLTSRRILQDREHLDEAKDVRTETPVSPRTGFETAGNVDPGFAGEPVGTPAPSLNQGPRRQQTGTAGGTPFTPERPLHRDAADLHADNDRRPDPSLHERPPPKKTRRSGVMRPFVKGLRLAAFLLLAAGTGTVGYIAGNPGTDLTGVTGVTDFFEAKPFRDRSGESSSMPVSAEHVVDVTQDRSPVSASLNALADRASLPIHPSRAAAPKESVHREPIPLVIEFWPADGTSRFTDISPDDLQRWDKFFQTAAQPGTRVSAHDSAVSFHEAAAATAGAQQSAAAHAQAAGDPDQSNTGATDGFAGMAYMPAKQGKLMEQRAARRSAAEYDAAALDSVAGPPLRNSETHNADSRTAAAPAERSNIDAATLLEFGRRLDAIEDRLQAMVKPKDHPELRFALPQPRNAPRSWPSFKRQSAAADDGGHSSLTFPAAKTGGAPAFSLVAGALSAESAALRDARIGDRVPGFGTVTDIISYAEGGRILVMQNGSVYLN